MATHSTRIENTDMPVIVGMQKLLREAERDVLSLAQGIVHWKPPASALAAASAALEGAKVNSYCAVEGIPELRDALKEKVSKENNLKNSDIMVTAGANQAFMNLVLALNDKDDEVVLFPPYYFNHKMALQMSNATIVMGRVDPDSLSPDVAWVRENINERTKMVVLVNPGNPTGSLIPMDIIKQIADACTSVGAWLILDNTYDYFTYNEAHTCMEGPNIVNIFSFSKAYGMMGWRIGYLAYPPDLHSSLIKVQDTIPICPTIISQHVALGAMEAGREWVKEKVQSLVVNREMILGALSVLPKGSLCGPHNGAIYFFVKLPEGFPDDEQLVKWLVHKHGICVIPGSSCGSPGYIRIAFGNLVPSECEKAAERLKKGLQELQQMLEKNGECRID